MPIYEFRCNACNHLFEELVPLNTTGENQKCPECGHVGARRLVSAFAAHGLENGHIAVGQKLTSLDKARASGKSESKSGESKSGESRSSGESASKSA